MNILYFCFSLFDLQFYDEIVTLYFFSAGLGLITLTVAAFTPYAWMGLRIDMLSFYCFLCGAISFLTGIRYKCHFREKRMVNEGYRLSFSAYSLFVTFFGSF